MKLKEKANPSKEPKGKDEESVVYKVKYSCNLVPFVRGPNEVMESIF